jgi:membrane protein
MSVRHIWILVKHTILGIRDDHCTRLAAAISYYALFSLIPLIIFLVSVFGFVLKNHSVQKDVIDQILSFLPLSETNGRSSVETALNNVKNISAPAAALSLVVTLWTASAMFAAVRTSLNTVFGVEEHRPFFQSKLLDFAQVGGVGLFLLGSIAFTAFIKTVQALSNQHLGGLAGDNPAWTVALLLGPAAVSFLAFLLLYRIVPASRPTFLEALPGAFTAMLLFETLKNSFAIYVANFNNYDVVYGSLSAVLLFLLYMYLSFNIVLIGGEVSSVVSKMERGLYDPELRPHGGGPSVSMRTRLLRMVKGLFVPQRPVRQEAQAAPHAVPHERPTSIQELRRERQRSEPSGGTSRDEPPGQSPSAGSAATGMANEN